MPAALSSMMCDVTDGDGGDDSSEHPSPTSRIMNRIERSFSKNYQSSGGSSRRKYKNSISTQSSSSLERISTSTCSEPCLGKDAQTAMSSEASNVDEAEEDDDYDDDDEEREDDEEEDEGEEEDDDEDQNKSRELTIEPFVSSWSFAMGTQRSMISTFGGKAPQSNVLDMEDWELEIVERAHRESRFLDLYADLSWRFYTHPPTGFCLARVAMRHGLTGFEGISVWNLPSKSRRDSDCSSASAQPHASGLDESTLTKIYPGQEYRGERGVASPAPPTSLISEKLSQMDVLSEKIWHEHNKVSQTDEMLQRKLHLRDMLYTAISPVFPMSGLYVVGSSLNGFGNNSSDMDLCLMITNKDLDQKNDAVVVLNLILSTLQYEKFVSSQKLILAKVPILRIKFAEPFEDITVDLNANNSVAIRNTHLLCYYSSYDWRVRPLVSAVKEWAKRKGINDANKSSFTSYSLVLMVIHYLQCGTTPRVLPNLQQAYPNRFSNKVDVRTLNVTMPLDPIPDDEKEKEESTSTPTSSEKATLGELLIGFLDYYANKFDYDRDAISIRQGRRVERAALAVRPKIQHGGSSDGDKETPPPSSSASSSSLHNGGASSTIPQHFWRSQWRCVCIEEPFTNSNTAHSIYDEMVFGAIKEAFREAHTELQNNYDLEKLMQCEPIKTSITNAGAAVFAATYEGERPPNSNSMPPGGLRGMQPQAVPIPFHYAPPPVIPMPQSAQQNHSMTSQLPQMPSMPLQQQQQQRGGAGGYPMMNNQRSNNHHNQQSSSFNPNQHNRRANNQNGGASRSSRSNESVKENRQNQNQRYPTTSTSSGANGQQKENVAVVTSDAAENKNSQNVQNLQSKPKGAKNDEGAKPKRISNTVAAVESGEKLPMSPSKVAQ